MHDEVEECDCVCGCVGQECGDPNCDGECGDCHCWQTGCECLEGD